MLIISDDQFADAELSYLEELLVLIDKSLTETNARINKADTWEVETWCDKGEYLIGTGFCLMQRYLFSTLTDTKLDPKTARQLGPKTKRAVPIAELIHSAANYWKHSPEWHIWLQILEKRSQRTIDSTLHGRDSADYPLSCLLADFCEGQKPSLVSCLPYLAEWRHAVLEYMANL